MINNVWILSNSGIPLFKKSYEKLNVEDELVSAFLTALQAFSREVTSSNIESIRLGNNKFVFEVDEPISVVINANIKNNELLLKDFLVQLKNKFMEKFKTNIDNFDGNASVFDEFKEDLEKLIVDNELKINCYTCSKVILNDFIPALHNGNSIYYCCQACKMGSSVPSEKNIKMLEKLSLYCYICKKSEKLPTHCDSPMILNHGKLICWMGPSCNSIPVPKHCGETMILDFIK